MLAYLDFFPHNKAAVGAVLFLVIHPVLFFLYHHMASFCVYSSNEGVSVMDACLIKQVSCVTKFRWCSVTQFNSQSLSAFFSLRCNGWHSLIVFCQLIDMRKHHQYEPK